MLPTDLDMSKGDRCAENLSEKAHNLNFHGKPVYCLLARPLVVQRYSKSPLVLYDRNRSDFQGLHAVSPVDLTVIVGLEDPCVKIKDLIALNLTNLAQNPEPIKIGTSFCKTAIQRTNTFVVKRRELVFSHRTLPERRDRDLYKTVPPFGVASDIEKFGLPKLLGIRKSFLKSRKDDSFILNKGKANAFTFTQALHPRILHRISKGHASVVTNLVLLGELNVFSIHPKINMKG